MQLIYSSPVVRYYSSTKHPQKCENQILLSALEILKGRLIKKNLKFPYDSLNLVPKLSILSLFDDFSKKVESQIEDKRSSSPEPNETLDLNVFVTPKFNQLPKILQLLTSDTYPKEFLKCLNLNSKEDALTDILSNLFLQHYSKYVAPFIKETYLATDYWGMQRAEHWFPKARRMRRKLIMHVGPTNSGKTHHSLKEFSKAKSGYYAGPLRMLAREVYERFNAQGISCNLITGEEIIPSIDDFGVLAGLSAGTIEMIPLQKKMDICIIDEIQMLADEQRGTAWTSAVLGVQAKEVHLCGEERAVDIVKKIADSTGEELEIKYYNRLGKLRVVDKPLKGIEELKSGDCVVYFSKKLILELKCRLEKYTSLKVGVIYGALPPEVRMLESSKFNSGEYDVLVASDAIGMGINLRIKRIVFGQTLKFNGVERIPLSPSSVKQIGGRAGRYSASGGELEGLITAFNKQDLEFVRNIMAQDLSNIQKAGIWPPDDFWLHYLSVSPIHKVKLLSDAFRKFDKDFKQNHSSDFFLMEIDTRTEIIDFLRANNLDKFLTVDDQLRLAQLPFNMNVNALVKDELRKIVMPIVKKESKTIFDLEFLNLEVLGATPTTKNEDNGSIYEKLETLELNHKLTLAFLWLAQRWPAYYIDKASGADVKNMLEKRIAEELASIRQSRSFKSRRQYTQDGSGWRKKDFTSSFEKSFLKNSKQGKNSWNLQSKDRKLSIFAAS